MTPWAIPFCLVTASLMAAGVVVEVQDVLRARHCDRWRAHGEQEPKGGRRHRAIREDES